MGWYGTEGKFPGLKAMLNDGWMAEGETVIASALVNMKQGWIIRENNTTKERTAILYLLNISKTDWMVKPLDEFCHPHYYDIPEKLFRMLTPIAETELNQYALAWRKEVSSRLDQMNSNRNNLRDNVLFYLGKELYKIHQILKSSILVYRMGEFRMYKLSKTRFYREAIITDDATGQGKLF